MLCSMLLYFKNSISTNKQTDKYANRIAFLSFLYTYKIRTRKKWSLFSRFEKQVSKNENFKDIKTAINFIGYIFGSLFINLHRISRCQEDLRGEPERCA